MRRYIPRILAVTVFALAVVGFMYLNGVNSILNNHKRNSIREAHKAAWDQCVTRGGIPIPSDVMVEGRIQGCALPPYSNTGEQR